MPLQFKNIAVGNLQDDVSGNNYAANKAVYILNLNNTLAQVFSDEAGAIPIVQDGVNNVTGAKGVFGFWVEAGDYFVQVGANKYRVSITGADYFNNRIDETIDIIVDSVAGRGAYYVVGSFEAGFTYTDINQVGTFGGTDYYVYTGGLTNLSHPVPAGTNPTLSSDYAQVFYGEIDNVQGLRDELNDRALYLTLAEAQAKTDLVVGQIIILTDHNNAQYKAVQDTDTGGLYKEGLQNSLKLKLEPINNELRLSWIGALNADATTQMQNFAAISDGLDVKFDYEVTFEVSDTVNFRSPKSIDFGKRTNVNCDAANTSTPLTVGSDGISLIHTFTAEYPEFSDQFIADTIAGLERGSVLSIWNPTDGSWSGFRPSYRQGEYVLVEEVQAGNVVQTQGKTQDAYPIGTQVYLLESTEIDLTGRLFVTNTGSYGAMFGLRAFQLLNSNQDGLKVGLLNGTHAYSLVMSMNCHGRNVEFYQEADQVSGVNYGIIHSSNQNCTFYGNFHADRHASTIGSGGQTGAAINRDIYSFGRFTTSGLGSVQAADMHGNSERCGYGGYLEGLIIGGNDGYVTKGSKIVSPKTGFTPVQFAEMKSFNHKIEATIEAYGEPSSRGIIDLGGNSESANINTVLDGVLDFSGCSITGSLATQGAVRIRNRGSLANFSVNLSGVTTNVPNSTNDFVFTSLSGNEVSSVTFNNEAWKNGIAAAGGINFIGIAQKGEYTFTSDTATNNDTRQVTFNSSFPSGYEPVVTVSDDRSKIGTTRILSEGSNNDELSFFSLVFTIDGSNFSSAEQITVRWKAEI